MSQQNSPDKPSTYVSILDTDNKHDFIKYGVRRTLALGGLAISFLVAGPHIRNAFDSLTASSPSIASKLAEPFRADQEAANSGEFAPGAVVETPLIYNDLNRDASMLSNSDYYGSQNATNEIKTDINAEVGGDPTVKEVYVPAADVNMQALPEGSHIVK